MTMVIRVALLLLGSIGAGAVWVEGSAWANRRYGFAHVPKWRRVLLIRVAPFLAAVCLSAIMLSVLFE